MSPLFYLNTRPLDINLGNIAIGWQADSQVSKYLPIPHTTPKSC